jgi:hypothetical protein
MLCENGPLFADSLFEREGKNRLALFVRDDEFLAIWCLSPKYLLAHHLASAFRGLLPYRIQVIELDAVLIDRRACFVFDVEEGGRARVGQEFELFTEDFGCVTDSLGQEALQHAT